MNSSHASKIDLMLNVSFIGMILDRVASFVACKDIASCAPSSEAILGIKGAIPDVEIVTLDRLTFSPIGSVRIRTALDTLRQLYNGSPCPMKTTLSIRADWFVSRNWETISEVLRFFKSFWVPVWQKVQESEHPTWLDKQIVFLSFSQIKTAKNVKRIRSSSNTKLFVTFHFVFR